jgi:hypothetical protein
MAGWKCCDVLMRFDWIDDGECQHVHVRHGDNPEHCRDFTRKDSAGFERWLKELHYDPAA